MGADVAYGDRSVTTRILLENGARAAAGFESIGIARGDVIAYCVRDDFPAFEVCVAASLLDARAVSVDGRKTPAEFAADLKTANAKAIVIHADLFNRLFETYAAHSGLAYLVVPTPADIVKEQGISQEASMPPDDVTTWSRWIRQFSPMVMDGLIDKPVW